MWYTVIKSKTLAVKVKNKIECTIFQIAERKHLRICTEIVFVGDDEEYNRITELQLIFTVQEQGHSLGKGTL